MVLSVHFDVEEDLLSIGRLNQELQSKSDPEYRAVFDFRVPKQCIKVLLRSSVFAIRMQENTQKPYFSNNLINILATLLPGRHLNNDPASLANKV